MIGTFSTVLRLSTADAGRGDRTCADPPSVARVSDDDQTPVRQRLMRLLPVGRGPVAWPTTVEPAQPATATSAEPAAIDAAGAASSPGDPAAAPARLLGGAGAFDPGRRGVKALAVVAAVVALGAAVWAWQARPDSQPVPPGSPVADPPQAAPAGTTTAGTAEVVVAVAGKVRRPGLVRLPAGARVADAIEAAGGPLPGTDITLLNLARKVSDGELIVVGVTPPPGTGGQPGASGGTGDATGGKVNLNTATQAQLETLPGVGPVLAQRILAYREQHGGFRSVGDLRRVDGIGDSRYEQLKDLVTV